jgi:predicted nucleic acid-binding protein
VSGAEAAAAYFVDSSALVKRYVLETGTVWVRRVTRQNASTVIYIAHITAVEVTWAVARRRKGRTLAVAKASSILHRFRQHSYPPFPGTAARIAARPSENPPAAAWRPPRPGRR